MSEAGQRYISDLRGIIERHDAEVVMEDRRRVIGELIDRMQQAQERLRDLAANHFPKEPEHIRLDGKMEGLGLAISYAEELLRQE